MQVARVRAGRLINRRGVYGAGLGLVNAGVRAYRSRVGRAVIRSIGRGARGFLRRAGAVGRRTGIKPRVARFINPGGRPNLKSSAGQLGPPPPPTRAKAVKRGKRVARSATGGQYTGNAKFRLKKRKVGKFALDGATHCNESFGLSTMSGCHYIGFQDVRPREIGRTIGMALIRYVMRRFYGIDYVTTNDKLNPYQTATLIGGFPVSINFEWEQGLGATISVGNELFTPATTDTVATFGTWFTTNIFNNTLFGGNGGSPTRILKWVSFNEIAPVNAAASSTYTVKRLAVDKLVLSAYSYSQLTLQNATASDSISKSTDVIDSNPLSGKIYKLNSLAPSIANRRYFAAGATVGGVATSNYPQLAWTDDNGIVLPASNATGQWLNPPPARFFDRVQGEASIGFQPGESKTYRMRWKFTGTINVLMQNLCQSGQDSGGDQYASRYGRCLGHMMLFALEKRIKGDGAVPIDINYHCDHYTGARVVRIARTAMDRDFTQTDRDNVAT